MKSLLGILLILSSMNIANAACTTYTNIPFVDDGFGHSLTNIVVEGYEYRPSTSSHSVTVNVESIDYAGNSLSCRTFQYSKPPLLNAADNLALDEFLKFLKLSMALGYKLRIDYGSVIGPTWVSVNRIIYVMISKP